MGNKIIEYFDIFDQEEVKVIEDDVVIGELNEDIKDSQIINEIKDERTENSKGY